VPNALQTKGHHPWPTLAALALSVVLGYGAVLDNGFFEIDDPTLLDHVSRGLGFTPHFRPLPRAWNSALFQVFGRTAWAYYAAGLALHSLNAFACAVLVWRLTSNAVAGITAGFVFALWYAPHQVILWISANCGLLSVALMLLTGIAWHSYVNSPARVTYLLSLLALAGAMASKEDCVVLAPLLIGIDACVQGARAFRPRAFARRYAAFAVLACAYVALAFRPSLWSDNPDIGRYGLGPELPARLLGNFALLFAIGQTTTADTNAALVAAGAALLAALALAAWHLGAAGRVIWTGLAVSLVGLAPTLPGQLPLAGTRYTYSAVIGLSLIGGGLASCFVRWTKTLRCGSRLRVSAAFALALWLGLQLAAVRSVESWRYERGCARWQRLVDTTRSTVLALRSEPSPPSSLAVIAPRIWNPADYANGVRFFLGDLVARAEIEWFETARDHSMLAGHLDPARIPVFTSSADGSLQPVDAGGLDELQSWLADGGWQGVGRGDGFPVVWLNILATWKEKP
jgi:hypothetical protein